MLILFGIWVAVAGGVAALAGLSGLRRVRRLRRDGVTAWALAVPEPTRQAGTPPIPTASSGSSTRWPTGG